MNRRRWAALLALVASACGSSSTNSSENDGKTDAGVDATSDAHVEDVADAATDSQPDAGGDARSDAHDAAGEADADAGTKLVLAAIGDYGVNDANEADVATMVKAWSPPWVITVGDNNYEEGLATTIDVNIGKYYSPFIGDYKGTYGSGSPANRFFPTPGNHDWGETRTPKDLTPYLDYFTLPGNERYYDVDLGGGLVHLYAMDSDPAEPDGNTATSVQAKWLQAKLAASTACYDVVYFHHPPYSSGVNTYPTMRWPFAAWGAEVVLSGHEHFYERLSVDGIPYLIDGLGGAYVHDFNATPDPHSLFRYNAAWGALKITADRTSARFEFWATTTTAAPIDAVKIDAACH